MGTVSNERFQDTITALVTDCKIPNIRNKNIENFVSRCKYFYISIVLIHLTNVKLLKILE